MEIRRILHLPNTLSKESGIVSVIMNYYRNIDKTKVQFDFLCFDTDKPKYEAEILALGGKVYYIPKTINPIKLKMSLKEFFYNHHKEYIAIHYHAISVWYLALRIAKQFGIKHRIAHSHATMYADKYLNSFRNKVMCLSLKVDSNIFFSCSKIAGKFLFGSKLVKNNKVFILNNAINLDGFKYDQSIRELYRKRLKIKNEFVICNVGRFSQQKNQLFLLDVFYELKKNNGNFKLLLIGEGKLEDKIIKKIQDLRLSEDIDILGFRDDVFNILQAVDAFVLPSLYEGLGIVLIEAQAAGLPCIASDVVPVEAKVSKSIEFISLSKGAKYWADAILKYKDFKRGSQIDEIRSSGYDITLEAKRLEKFYLGLG